MKARKKPVEIDVFPIACALELAERDWNALPVWIRAAYDAVDITFVCGGIQINTIEGSIFGGVGSWIAKGVEGELYPIKDSILRKTHDLIEE